MGEYSQISEVGNTAVPEEVQVEPRPKLLTILDITVGVLLTIATTMVFFYAPMERVMGQVQRIFYFHVSAAWVGMLGFLVATIAAIIYLVKKDLKWDRIEVAAVEISVVFLSVATVTGSIWARPAWNTWWNWDTRLTTTTIMVLLYVAYLMLRQGLDDPERRARFGAVYAILAFVSVPLTYLSIHLFETIHPVVFGAPNPGAEGDMNMTPQMFQTFMFSLFVFSLMFTDLLWHRIRLGTLASKVEQLRLKLM